MNILKDISGQDFAERSDRDVASLLMKIQRQLTFIENKLDRLTEQIQGDPQKERQSFDPRLRKKTYTKASQDSRPRRVHGKKKSQGKQGDKERDVPFYSKFQKGRASAGAGAHRKNQHPKRKNKE
jgi:hypothetical protein